MLNLKSKTKISWTIIATIVFLTSCSSSNSPSADDSLSSNSEPTLVTSVTPEPSQSSNPFGVCPYDIVLMREELIKQSQRVVNNWTGNSWLNADLSLAIQKAEKISEDPSCTEEANMQQLPQIISSSKQVLNIGQGRVEDSLRLAREIRDITRLK